MREYNVLVEFLIDPPLKRGDFDRLIDAVFEIPTAAQSCTQYAGFTTTSTIVFNVGAERMADAVSGGVAQLERMLLDTVPPATTATIARVEACTLEESLRWLERPTLPTMVGVAEIAELIGRSQRKTVMLLAKQSAPRPYAELAIGPVWNEAWLRRFVERYGRTTK